MPASALAATVFISFYCWDAYYFWYAQVVHNQSIENAGYIYNIYCFGSGLFTVIVGVVIKYTRQFQLPALCIGVCKFNTEG
ncbi:hypothetical protein FN846DRAFT_1006668 [Sphaerosporella brunnea]|uniref:Uncharacterized protein n=1 Tax=Sphaerosporella brunnea TaxID=1250544 RepID=A0A5J5ED16_9PEZI|nr:hypothetical protein FN846DRAFT_1006668 [Sphaerosporella brunnea]